MGNLSDELRKQYEIRLQQLEADSYVFQARLAIIKAEIKDIKQELKDAEQ